MKANLKILEVNSVGDLVLDADSRDLRQNFFEEAIGVRNAGENFIVQRDFGTKGILTTPPIRPNAFKVITAIDYRSGDTLKVTIAGHGYSNGAIVYIDETEGYGRYANGKWEIEGVTTDYFYLVGSLGDGSTSSGAVGICSTTPITIHRAFIFYDKEGGGTYPVVFGIDSSGNSRLYVYDAAAATGSNNYSYWLEVSRFLTADINGTPSAGAAVLTYDGLLENSVSLTGGSDFVNNWICFNFTQSEAVLITDSDATTLTLDTVVGANGLAWVNNDVIQIYRFPTFKYNWTADNGASPHVDFHFIQNQRKLNILYTNSATPKAARQAIQLMRRNARNYFPTIGVAASAQIIYGTPTTGNTVTVVSGAGSFTYIYNHPSAYGFLSVGELVGRIQTYNTDVNVVNASGTITVTAKSAGVAGNSFYLTTNSANLQVSNASQGATSSGTRYFEGGTAGGSYLHTLPAGWYVESDFGVLNPYFLARGSTTSSYTANVSENIYDQTAGRPWLITNSKRTTDATQVSSITRQRVYLCAEYGGYQRSDPLMQLFIEASSTTTGSPVSDHYLGINFALMNKELSAITLYACQKNSEGVATGWIDSSEEYVLCYTVNIQAPNTNGGFFALSSPYTISQIYTFGTTATTYLTITPTTITDAETSGAQNIKAALNHEPDPNRSYPLSRFAAMTSQSEGITIVLDGGDDSLFLANRNGSGTLEDDNFADVRTDISGNRIKISTGGVGEVLGLEILDGIIHLVRSNVVELYDLQGVFVRQFKIDCVSSESIHVTPYGIFFAGKSGINLIPSGAGQIVSISSLMEDYYNGSQYVTGVTPYISDAYRAASIGGYDETYKESWFNITENTATGTQIVQFRYKYETGKWKRRKLNTASTLKHFASDPVNKNFYLVTSTSILVYPNRSGNFIFEDDVKINGSGTEFSQDKSVLLDATLNISQFDDEVQLKNIDSFKLNFEGESANTYGLLNCDFLANEETRAFDTQYVRIDRKMEDYRKLNRVGELERLRIRIYLADSVNNERLDIKKLLFKFSD